MREEKFEVETVCEAIRSANGMLSVAARMLGCDRRTVHNYRDRHAEVAEAIADSREAILDLCEQRLVEKIDEGDMRAILFTLKTLGASRGYIERQWQIPLGEPTLTETEVAARIEKAVKEAQDQLVRSLPTETLQAIVDQAEAQGLA